MTTERKTPERPLVVPPIPEPRIVAVPGPLQIKDVPAHLSNYSRTMRHPSVIVLHATDGHEGVTKDTDCAVMFARPFPPGQPKRSSHYVVDTDSTTRCVRDEFAAWHCGHHGNAIGIGIELCGRADQTRPQWLDALSLPMLCIAARLCAELCRQWQIPARVVNDRGLLAEEQGITTHAFVAQAWKETTHYDPGPGFPMGAFVTAVNNAVVG